MRRLGVFVLLALALPAVALAAMYKWVDENGDVYYSDKKPPEVESAEEIRKQNYGVSDDQAASQLESLTDKANAQQEDRETKASINAEQASYDEAIKQNCNIARKNLTLLTSTARVVLKDEDGNDYFLPEADKENKILDAQAQVDRYCS